MFRRPPKGIESIRLLKDKLIAMAIRKSPVRFSHVFPFMEENNINRIYFYRMEKAGVIEKVDYGFYKLNDSIYQLSPKEINDIGRENEKAK